QRRPGVGGGRYLLQLVEVGRHGGLQRGLNGGFVQQRAGVLRDVLQLADDGRVLLVVLVKRLVGVIADRHHGGREIVDRIDQRRQVGIGRQKLIINVIHRRHCKAPSL